MAYNKKTAVLSFKGVVQKFPGAGGWVYVAVPKQYTAMLKAVRHDWGKYPITATVGCTTWETKLMMKKGGDFFVALNASVRKREESIRVGKRLLISFRLD